MAVKIDYDSIPRSYREYLELMVKEGEYLAIDDEVDWDLEIGAICRYADETLSPSPIFNKIKDSPGFRAAEWGFTKSGTLGRPWARVAANVRAARCHADGNHGSLHALRGKQPGAPAGNRRCRGCTLQGEQVGR